MEFFWYSILVIFIILAVIVIIKTLRFKAEETAPIQPSTLEIDAARAANNLSSIIKFKSISNPDPSKVEWDEFLGIHKYLQDTYPLIHHNLKREVIDNYSLLYTWEGASNDNMPIALLSHMDVVPVMPGTEDDWTHDAFSGHIDDDFIWGRGAMDMKGHLITVMESVENLLASGHKPQRTIYLCFGHNEEIVGSSAGGAYRIMETLRDRGIKLDCIIDEGGAVTPGSTLGATKDIAVVSIAEKGYVDLLLTVEDQGGHSSQPPKITGLTRMSNIVLNIAKHPFKSKLTLPVEKTFLGVGPYMPLVNRIFISNLWLFKGLFLKVLSLKPLTNAMIRTTGVATMASASPAANVLPQKTQFTLNWRTLPGDSIADVIEHIKRCSGDDGLEVTMTRGKESSAVAPTDTIMWNNLEQSLKKVFGDIVVAPYLMMGGTDSCMYEPICENIYRISPYKMMPDILKTIHSTDERMDKKELEHGIKFMMEFIIAAD